MFNTLAQLAAGSRFIVDSLHIQGTLLKVNDCRAQVRVNNRIESWSPATIVRKLELLPESHPERRKAKTIARRNSVPHDAPKDAFGQRIGTSASRINAALAKKAKTLDEIMKQSECDSKSRVRSHLYTLCSKDFAHKTETGRYCLGPLAPVSE